MWGNIRVTTVIPFERHVHLNISFSSTPCFLISSNCPLYKINHFGFTSVLTFFFFFPSFPSFPGLNCLLVNQNCGLRCEWSCGVPVLCPPVNQNEKNGPRFCLAFVCRSGPPGWCLRPSATELGSEQNLSMDATPRTRVRDSSMRACVALTWRNAIYPAGVFVPSLLLLICISGWWTHRDLCLDEKLRHFQWLTLNACMQVLRFHPTAWHHKLNNLRWSSFWRNIQAKGLYLYRSS